MARTFRLVTEVAVDLNGTDPQEIVQNLLAIPRAAFSEGDFTGESAAEIDTWSAYIDQADMKGNAARAMLATLKEAVRLSEHWGDGKATATFHASMLAAINWQAAEAIRQAEAAGIE